MWEYRKSEIFVSCVYIWCYHDCPFSRPIVLVEANSYAFGRCRNLQTLTQQKFHDITSGTSHIYQSFQRNIVHGDVFWCTRKINWSGCGVCGWEHWCRSIGCTFLGEWSANTFGMSLLCTFATNCFLSQVLDTLSFDRHWCCLCSYVMSLLKSEKCLSADLKGVVVEAAYGLSGAWKVRLLLSCFKKTGYF